MEFKVAVVTVRLVFPDRLPAVAVMTEVPAATPVASPLALMVATLVVPDDQTTAAVRFCVVLSE